MGPKSALNVYIDICTYIYIYIIIYIQIYVYICIYVDMCSTESHMFAYIAKLLSDQDAGVTPSQV